MTPQKNTTFHPNGNSLIFRNHAAKTTHFYQEMSLTIGKLRRRILWRKSRRGICPRSYACSLSNPVEEATEFDYLLENIEGEKGNTDGAVVEGRTIYESVLVNKKTTNTDLKVTLQGTWTEFHWQ
jgi:hypothetical protein